MRQASAFFFTHAGQPLFHSLLKRQLTFFYGYELAIFSINHFILLALERSIAPFQPVIVHCL